MHEELVVRTAPGVRGGHGAERPALGDHTLGATHRVLVELGWPEVPMHGALRREARGLQSGGPSAFGGAGGMRGHAVCSYEKGSGTLTPSVLLRVHGGDDGHVHDIVYVGGPPQHMHKLWPPHPNRAAWPPAAGPAEQLFADVCG